MTYNLEKSLVALAGYLTNNPTIYNNLKVLATDIATKVEKITATELKAIENKMTQIIKSHTK